MKEYIEIVGNITLPTKLPCASYDIPIASCKTGMKLAKEEGSVCSECYGTGGWFPVRKYKQEARLRALHNPLWTEAMIYIIERRSPDFFRWHDIGDVQSLRHLQNIFNVCLGTPDTKHWLPTHEHKLIELALTTKGMVKPPNLNIQLSADMLDESGPTGLARKLGLTISSVSTDGQYSCPAPDQFNSCGNCRSCWDTNHFVTIFLYHKGKVHGRQTHA